MIGQQLQGDGGHQRLQAFQHVGQLYHLVGNTGYGVVALRHEGNHPTLPRLNLLDVGEHLLIHGVVGGYHHHGHVAVDQGYGAVLHLGGRIALGVDVADFLQLQSALQGYGIAVAAA